MDTISERDHRETLEEEETRRTGSAVPEKRRHAPTRAGGSFCAWSSLADSLWARRGACGVVLAATSGGWLVVQWWFFPWAVFLIWWTAGPTTLQIRTC